MATPDIYFGSATGLSSPHRMTTNLTATAGAAVGDFDHDGFVDLVVAGASGG